MGPAGSNWGILCQAAPTHLLRSIGWQLGLLLNPCSATRMGGEREAAEGAERGQALLRGWAGLGQPAGSSGTPGCNPRCTGAPFCATLLQDSSPCALVKILCKDEADIEV